MWNVKCGVSEDIKEGTRPRGAHKINDPGLTSAQNKERREKATVCGKVAVQVPLCFMVC